MLTGLTRKVTLAAVVFLVLIALVTAFVLLTTTTVQDETMQLSDELLPQLDAKGDVNTSMAKALGEIEAFAYSHEPIKLTEAQEFLGEVEEATAHLKEIAAQSDPRDDPDEYAANQQILERQTAVLEEAEQLVASLMASSVAPASEIVEQVDRLNDELEAAEEANDVMLDQHRAEVTGLLATSVQSVIIGAVGLGILCVALVLLALIMLQRAIVRPIVSLADVAEQVAAGDLEQTVPASGPDEIGALQRSFNTMVGTLGQQTQQLQQEVDAANTARATAETARAELAEQLQTIEEQRGVIREMSVPILPLSDHALVMPLIGTLDTARLQLTLERALHAITQRATRYALLDITGVPLIDTRVGRGLLEIIKAARLLGTEVVLVGIRPEVAQTIVELGIPLEQVTVRSTLQDGIVYAFNGR
jgi:rsbT co-antagonist protein RsbR